MLGTQSILCDGAEGSAWPPSLPPVPPPWYPDPSPHQSSIVRELHVLGGPGVAEKRGVRRNVPSVVGVKGLIGD